MNLQISCFLHVSIKLFRSYYILNLRKILSSYIRKLEIKPCRFESRIRDMETESYNKSDFFDNPASHLQQIH